MSFSHYLIIAGPIGVGKSSLTAQIETHGGYSPLFEEPDDNPYLADFYHAKTGAFETQLAFLGQKIQQCKRVKELIEMGVKVVQDRSIYEDSHIFTKHHYQQGMINPVQYTTYMHLFEGIAPFLPQPDLIVYLSASVDTLLSRIKQRGRSYEKDIERAYLQDLNALYEDWAFTFSQGDIPFLQIETDHQGSEQIYEHLVNHIGLRSPLLSA